MMKAFRRFALVFGALALWLVGCRAVANAPTATRQPPKASATLPVTATPRETSLAIETPVAAPLLEQIPLETYLPPTVAPDPLRFVFPDAGPAPVSAWRPPLYPVPWAPTPHDHFYFYRPIAADEVNWPDANYRYGGVFFEGEVHTGIDIPAPEGTPVLAVGDGKVIWADYGLYRMVAGDLSDPYGLAVVIRHDFGFEDQQLFSVYGHLQRLDVERGQKVMMGQTIGLVGQTGNVTGPHLHFEVRVGGSDFFSTLNPELWLVPPQGWGVAVGRVMDSVGKLYADELVRFISLETGQRWKVKPYAGKSVNSDPYYGENLVISDLPAGMYEVQIDYGADTYNTFLVIDPGRVTFFSFKGRHGFSFEGLPDPVDQFDPAQAGFVFP
jgi:murein DD-endopeptidase MepM/ murein hydrolase activator NlpD